jgi:hypothetical protein
LLRRAGLGVAALIAAALVAAGCAGDDDESAESWASSVCAGMSTWLAEVDEALPSLTDDGLAVNEDDVRSAVDQAEEATAALVEDLEELGPPDTERGEEAQSELEDLLTALRSEAEAVQEAIDSESGTAELASTVTMSVSEAYEEISFFLAELRGSTRPVSSRRASTTRTNATRWASSSKISARTRSPGRS